MPEPPLEGLTTEGRNPRTERLDTMSAAGIVAVMNGEDAGVAAAVGRCREAIAAAIEAIAVRMRQGGRLVYVGAGTSGRLGVLDATECVPTFSAAEGQVVGLIAGGERAFRKAVEGAEDDPAAGAADLDGLGLTGTDAVAGIATSGRTPYVIGALEHARTRGALTVALVCNEGSPVAAAAAHRIEVVVGPEVLSGSTRLKAGTATKMVLNMLSTGAFVRLGKTYGNLMVDLQATNAKLVARSRRIVAQATGCTEAEAAALLDRCDGEVKTAIVARSRGVAPERARDLLARADGHVRAALEA